MLLYTPFTVIPLDIYIYISNSSNHMSEYNCRDRESDAPQKAVHNKIWVFQFVHCAEDMNVSGQQNSTMIGQKRNQ